MDQGRYQDKQYLQGSQYKDSTNLSARAQLHQKFSTAKMDWNTWVFDQLRLEPGYKILECGCGPGWLWRRNLQSIPAGCRITLTDFSPGMVAEAEAALAGAAADFHFRQADIQDLSFVADASVDIVIANHMLYHVPNIEQALSEVHRVLRPGGRLHAITNGAEHMRELKELRIVVATRFGLTADAEAYFTLPFRLENGAELLSRWFAQIELIPFDDSLRVTEIDPLLEYAFSAEEVRAEITESMLAEIKELVAGRLAAEGGAMHITKAVGMFVATKQA